MKKLVVLFSLAFLIFSCSSDDDSTSENSKSALELIGTWKLFKRFVNLEELQLNECEDMSTVEFTSTEIIDIVYHEVDNQCVVEEVLTVSYTATSNTITSNGFNVDYSIKGLELTRTARFPSEEEGEEVIQSQVYIKQ